MVKRVVVTGLKARGYVDGRYVGEEKKEPNAREDVLRGRKRRGKSGGSMGLGQGQGIGIGKRGGKRGSSQAGSGANDNIGNTVGGKRGRRGKPPGGGARGTAVAGTGGVEPGNSIGHAGQSTLPHGEARPPRNPRGQPRTQSRKNTSGRKTPFRKMPPSIALAPSPSQVGDTRRIGEEAKSGQFAEALAAQANVKRERLHKVMAQSGIGSRRDMEIMISTGRVMVNGIVATTGTQVSPGDNVMVDQRPIKLKFSEDLPRILLYHKPEGEIVTTSDPGNRITVFDNLPPVETGKWIAIGRLDINTSGLLIFTTNGELANRFMHPRYEVEREYAVRILGELTEHQTEALLTGVNIDAGSDEHDHQDQHEHHQDNEDVEHDHQPSAPARFDTIEKRGGEGVNQWYHVTIKEGRNREVRKMFESQGLTVSRLIRTRFGKIELPPRLSRGKLMELSPDQVRSVLAGAGMKDEAELALPGEIRADSRGAGRGQRGPGAARGPGVRGIKPPRPPRAPREGQPPRPPREGQPPRQPHEGPAPRQPREGSAPRQPREGSALEGGGGGRSPRDGIPGAADGIVGQERVPGSARPRRNRRGGKSIRRDPNFVGSANEAGNSAGNADDNQGNRVDTRGNIPPPEARIHGEAHDSIGNMTDGATNIITHADPEAPAGTRGAPRNPHGRQRRNFRGRGGRNRGPKGGSDGGGEGGGAATGSDGGGNSGESGGSGGSGGKGNGDGEGNAD